MSECSYWVIWGLWGVFSNLARCCFFQNFRNVVFAKEHLKSVDW